MAGPRGESRILLPDGGEITVLFTNRALAEAETALNKSVLQLARQAADGGIGIGDIAQLLAVGMEYARRDAGIPGPRLNLSDAYRVLDAVGFVAAAQAVLESLAAVLSYQADNPPAAGRMAASE